MIELDISKEKKVYFASDQHFGAPTTALSKTREQRFLYWLDSIEADAGALFLLGDLFDFWFEYKTVVPKGFVRILGKIALIRDKGIPVFFFVGNHDLWMNDYFETELNIPVFHKPQLFKINNKIFFIGHGDGLGPGDRGYKRMKKVFTNPFSKWLFRWLHPDLGVRLAQYMSIKNKLISGEEDARYLGEENEWLVQYSKRKLQKLPDCDYFIFGHRHLPMIIDIGGKTKYINLGDWIQYFTFGVLTSEDLELYSFDEHYTSHRFHPISNRDA